MNRAGSDQAGADAATDTIRVRLDVRGRVQGVGFRPFVYRLACELGVSGFVGNSMDGAFVEAEGPARDVELLARRLQAEAPPLADIAAVVRTDVPVVGDNAFRIERSSTAGEPDAEVSPDVGTCPDCLREMRNPRDRRHGYPFINCTNCGPRYSIVHRIPYDRRTTTMAAFSMCAACQREYDDPADRRFHAQPNACRVCGPAVWFVDRTGARLPGNGIDVCREYLARGAIVAVKGLGGFHLACRADSDAAVSALRERKGREAKPLAVMIGDLAAAAALVELDRDSRAALESWRRPIVLAPKRADAALSCHVAPGCSSFGVMLPYTPVHHLLFDGGLGPLVMTSANPTDEPLCFDNSEAVERLSGIADAFLLHNRDIARPVDDSVVLSMGDAPAVPARVVPVRRSRGHVPEPLAVTSDSAAPVLAVGGDLKSAVCLLKGRQAVLSEHLGELSNPKAFRNFAAAISRLKQLTRTDPSRVVSDLHPGYHSVRFAASLGLHHMQVQHHHAHVLSCMADNGLEGSVLGLAADGTGYGTDGQVWGCELLRCDGRVFRRVGHLRYFPLPGGDAVSLEPWRPAASLLRLAFGNDWRRESGVALDAVPAAALDLFDERLGRGRRLPLTSSLGRLFDAAAFVLGVCVQNRFEAEAAMGLEAVASRCGDDGVPELPSVLAEGGDTASFLFDPVPLIRSLALAARSSTDAARCALARGFHRALARLFAAGIVRAAEEERLNRVVLSGGCFLNRLLVRMLSEELAATGLAIYIHSRVPPGDGGLALGQAVFASMEAE